MKMISSTTNQFLQQNQPIQSQGNTQMTNDNTPNFNHVQYGQPTQKWAYHYSNGDVLCYSCRFDMEDGSKQVLPYSLIENDGIKTWRWQKLPSPHPLFNLYSLVQYPERTVLIVEGEKSAEAAQKLFPHCVATTSIGGAMGAAKSDWSILAGRSVIIWPDNDAAGQKYANDVATILYGIGVPSIKIVTTDQFPPKWDLADEVPSGIDIYIAFENTNLFDIKLQIEPPKPLRRPLPKSTPFPVDALGETLGGAVHAIVDMVRCPEAIAAQSVIAAASLVVQGHADIVLPIGDGSVSPCSLYLMTIASSGERKSAADKRALKPVNEREHFLEQQRKSKMLEYTNASEIYEADRKKILSPSKSESNFNHTKDVLEGIGAPPKAPLDSQLTVPEPTFEALCKLFVNGQPSLGLFSDEGGQFVGGFSMSSEQKLKTAAGLSGLWDGSPIKRTRVVDGTSLLYGRRLAVHLLIQPEAATKMLSDNALMDQGILSRLLIAAPEPKAGTRFHSAILPSTYSILENYTRRLTAILQRPFLLAPDTQNELTPRQLHLSQESKKMWFQFADHVESQLGKGGSLSPITGLANKLPEHAARIAGVLSLIENINCSEVSPQMMQNGIQLVNFYANEALRLWGNSCIGNDIRMAEVLLEWLNSKWHHDLVSLPDIYQAGPNSIRVKNDASIAAKVLQAHGWLEPVMGGAVVNGVFRKDVWRVVRMAITEPDIEQFETPIPYEHSVALASLAALAGNVCENKIEDIQSPIIKDIANDDIEFDLIDWDFA